MYLRIWLRSEIYTRKSRTKRKLLRWSIRPKLNYKTQKYESRFDLAYNASHALALAALRSHGYRSSGRYLVFQCLEHTLNIPPEQWRVLDDAHRKRNNAQYEGNFEVSEGLVDSVIEISKHMLTTITSKGDLGGQVLS